MTTFILSTLPKCITYEGIKYYPTFYPNDDCIKIVLVHNSVNRTGNMLNSPTYNTEHFYKQLK